MARAERLEQVACAAITTAAAVRCPRERGLDNGKVRYGMSGVGEQNRRLELRFGRRLRRTQVKQKFLSWRRRVRRPHVEASRTRDKSETSGTPLT